jgi:hypothetical protein
LALAASNPAVAETIRDLRPDKCFRFERSAAGWFVAIDEAEGGVPLASLEDPLDEYRDYVRRFAPKAPCTAIFWGFGCGYGFLAVCLELGDRVTAALVIEPDPSLFRAVLSVLDLSKVLRSPGLRIVLGQDVAKLETSTLDILPNLLGTERFILRDQVSWDRYGSYLSGAEQVLDRLIERAQAEARFFSEWGPQIEENIWRNAPLILTSPVFGHFAGRLSGSPAILVSGGPSLAQDLPELAALKSLPLIVAVDTSYPVLQQAGIEPHIVVTCDPTPLNQRHFEATHPNDDTALVFDPESYFEIPRQWSGPRSVLNAGESPTSAWLRELSGERVRIRKPISVAHAALGVALILGCDPIILLGWDFAYDPRGGGSHVRGSALVREHGSVRGDQQVLELSLRSGRGATICEPLVWLPGKRGGQVPASRTLALFAAEVERCLVGAGTTVIDAGSGGTRLGGTVCKTFEEIRGLFASAPLDRRQLAKAFTEQRPRSAIALADLRDEALAVLERAALDARGALSQCDRRTDVENGTSLQWIEEIFWKIRRDPAVERVFGLALYSSTFALIYRQGSDSPAERYRKLKSFFDAVLDARERLLPAIMTLPERT